MKKTKTQTQAQEMPELEPIKGLSKGDVIGKDTAYIHTAIPVDAPGQIWRMMARPRMLQIFTYAFNKYKLDATERMLVHQAIFALKQKP
jgi:hypothetical protein